MLAELVRLDRVLADRFADATLELLREAGVDPGRVAVIGSHGQTVAHHPEHGGTLQIGCPARLAERLGRPVVADFRRRDMAMGGEGAPLAPFFHHAVFTDPDEDRGVLNLGGIANLTFLPAGDDRGEGVMAFDVGPANSLLDGVVTLESGGRTRCDVDGERARKGRVVDSWLAEMLGDPYLARPAPKSTGRERYGLALARRWLDRARQEGVEVDDLLRTLTEFSARAVALAWADLARTGRGGRAGRILVGGGGVRNRFGMEALRRALPEVAIEPMDRAGVPADAAEAMAFSLLARNALMRIPNQLPRVTGVAEARVLGVVHGVEWLRA
jgi:anhydro-N-acetylmuramic acid kinase